MDSGHGMRECGGGVATEKPVKFFWLPTYTFDDGDTRLTLSTSLSLFDATTVTADLKNREKLSPKDYGLLHRLFGILGATNVWLHPYSLTLHLSPWAGRDIAERNRVMSEVIDTLQSHYGFGTYTVEVASPTPSKSERDRQNLDRMVEAAKPIVAYYFAADSPDDGEDAPRLDRRHIKALADAFAACVGDGR